MMARQLERSTVRTDELKPGDRVRLPGGLVRTFSEVRMTGWANYRNEPILAVMYLEGKTPEWSEGNSSTAGGLWLLA